jgi:hypothetical protein
MRTILNGAFEVDTGDMIQWYWSAETNCFDANGRRLEPIPEQRSQGVATWLQTNDRVGSSDSARRKAFHERGNGVFTNSQTDGTVTFNAKREVAFPKSIRPGKNGVRLGDRMRVFARAMSGARPYEMVDIMICRQSMLVCVFKCLDVVTIDYVAIPSFTTTQKTKERHRSHHPAHARDQAPVRWDQIAQQEQTQKCIKMMQ